MSNQCWNNRESKLATMSNPCRDCVKSMLELSNQCWDCQISVEIKSVKFQFNKFCCFFRNNKYGMIFHENRLSADDSHEISYLIFFRKLGKMSQNLKSLLQSWLGKLTKLRKEYFPMTWLNCVCVYSPIVELGKEMAALTALLDKVYVTSINKTNNTWQSQEVGILQHSWLLNVQ